jgi:hypothetical protein
LNSVAGALAALIAAGGLVASGAGCQSCQGKGVTKEDLELAPKEAERVFVASFARMRNTGMWRKLLDFRDGDPQIKNEYDDFVARCGLDPAKQIDSLFLAFPGVVDEKAEFLVVLRGTFDEKKLVACATEQARKDGGDITSTEVNGKTVYQNTRSGGAYGTFLDSKTVVLGGKEWVKKAIDLAAGKKEAGPTAKENAELMALIKRVKTSDAMWGVGTVSESTRQGLSMDPQLSVASTLKAVLGSVDFATGLMAHFAFDLAGQAEADQLAQKVTAQLADARKHPQFMMAGLGQFLDKVKIEAKGPTFFVTIDFTQAQVDDLINRLRGLLQSLKGQIGNQLGLGGGGGGGEPVAAPPSESSPAPTPTPAPDAPSGKLQLKPPSLGGSK